MIFRIGILLLVMVVTVSLAGASPLQTENIRVAIAKGADSVRIGGSGLLATDGAGDPVRLDVPVQVRRVRGGVSLNGRTVGKLVISAPAFVIVNGRGYRGVVEITSSDQGLLVVNELPLEEYLVGLINCEISSQWPIEAVKAQAVVARTYAVYQREARKNGLYQLESSVLDQVYAGCDIEDSRADRAVKETAGEVLTYDGNVIQAFYHSSCGGHTESAENVWGHALPYLKGVECKYCKNAPSVKWAQTLPLRRIEALLRSAGYRVTGLRDIAAGPRDESGRLRDVVLTTARARMLVPGTKFRMAVGSTVIKSTNFEVRVEGADAVFNGVGYGHGVGLCQWGAKQRAADGFNYREILSYYYPGTKLVKLYGE